MIISHKYKFVFIKTEKTAGTSIEIALSRFCGDMDIITPIVAADEEFRKKLGYKQAQNYYMPFRLYSKCDWVEYLSRGYKKRFYNHISAQEIKKAVSNEVWDTYYKFTFERNPWDKAVSYYYWKNRNGSYKNFTEFMEAGAGGRVKGFDLYSIGGKVVVDDVFRFEKLEESMELIKNKIGLPSVPDLKTIKTKSGIRNTKKGVRELITKKEEELISLYAAREIRLMDYKIPSR